MPQKQFRASIWLVWLLLAALLTARYFWWEVGYFRSPGAMFQTLLLWALPLFAAACAAYLWLRRKWLWRFEVPALAACAGMCLLLVQPVATLVSLLLFGACLAVGCRLASVARVTLKGPAEVLAVGFGLGCALLIPVLFGLGLAHLYYSPVFILLLVIPCLAFRREVRSGIAAFLETSKSTAGLSHPLAGIAFVFGAIATASTLAVVLSPSIAFDPLALHLASARQYAAWHALEALPSLDYSYFPQGCEVLMALAWSLGGQPAAQMISPLFWGLSLLLLFAVGRSCGLGKAAAFAGVVAAATMPFAHWTASNAKNDSALMFFQAAALFAFIRWVDTRSRAWILIGALFLGSTFAIKHVALFGAIPLVCFFLYALYTSRRVRLALAFCLIAAGSALYWHVRTGLLTGNPVYPATLKQSLRAAGSKPAGYGRLARFWLVPWRAQFEGSRAFESPLPNPMGVALLVFLPFAILIPGVKAPARRACLVFCAIYLVYWMATISAVRYAILPISLLVVLLVGKGLRFYDESGHRFLRASVAGALTGVLLFAALGTAIIEINVPMLMLFAHRIHPDRYLDLALRTHESLAWLDAAHTEASIFGFDNCSRAYAPDPARFYCALDDWNRVEPDVARCRCEYLVLPKGRNPGHAAEPVHADPYFTVWRFKQPVAR